MKKLSVILVILLSFIAGLSGTCQAKWWIFGKSDEGVRIHYMYLNKVSFDNSVDPDITIFKGNLIDGNLIIKGKASASNGQIGSVLITLDNKETWQKANLSRNGSFEFAFAPEINNPYEIFVKILDTTGKTNDVEATYKKLKVIDTDVSDLVRKSLDKLFEAYQEQDPSRFMRYVSPGFESDETLLDTAVRKDFNTFDHIQIQYLVNTIVSGSGSRIYVSLNYNRSVISTKSGDMLSDHGATEFVFTMENDIPKLVRIKNPLLFGLSDAANVATGTINSGTNDPILLVNEYGDVQQKPFPEAIEIIEGGNIFSTSSGNTTSGSFTLLISCLPPCNTADGFNFTNDIKTTLISDSEFYKEGAQLFGNNSTVLQNLGNVSIDGITVPEAGYFDSAGLNSGEAVAVKLPNTTYGVLKVTSLVDLGGGSFRASFNYKYNPSGSRTFN
jgi:hypothetical protein